MSAFTLVPKVTGFEEVNDKIASKLADRLGNSIKVDVVAGGKRGAVRNGLIAQAQANRRRNPFYINPRRMQAIKFLVRGLTSRLAYIRNSSAKAIGDEVLGSVHDNVKAQKNVTGDKFQELTAAYAKRKRRKFGFVKPILRATGDLLGGLMVRITRSRG